MEGKGRVRKAASMTSSIRGRSWRSSLTVSSWLAIQRTHGQVTVRCPKEDHILPVMHCSWTVDRASHSSKGRWACSITQ